MIVFDINETSPKLHIKISEIDDNWNKIYNVLSPLALTKPYILKFKPDFGFHLKRIGFDSTSEFIFLSFWCNFLGKLSDDKYSLSSYFPFEEQTYCATFDFDKALFQKLLEIIPYDRREKLKQALTNYPFKIGFATKEESINIGVVSRLSPKLEFGRSEAFVPFIIVEFKKKI